MLHVLFKVARFVSGLWCGGGGWGEHGCGASMFVTHWQEQHVDHMWLQQGMFLLGCRYGCSGHAWFLGSACNQTDVNRLIPSMLATCIGEGP